MAEWDIAVGETLLRRELHDRWGGGRYGGMEPAPRAKSVLLFSKPSAGAAFGYKYDGWHDDGSYHYTGDGQEGDQSPEAGGNKSLIDAPALGRAVRVFRSEGVHTTYVGEFELLDPGYYRADAPDRNGEVRSVLVFRLRPVGNVLRQALEDAAPDLKAPQMIALEANDIDAYVMARPDEPPNAVRREAELVKRYATWLGNAGHATARHRIPLPEGGSMLTDIYNVTADELIEAKASSARSYVRSALGQVLDYSRYLNPREKSVLLPTYPGDDLVALLHAHRVGVWWPTGSIFRKGGSANSYQGPAAPGLDA